MTFPAQIERQERNTERGQIQVSECCLSDDEHRQERNTERGQIHVLNVAYQTMNIAHHRQQQKKTIKMQYFMETTRFLHA